MLILLDIGNSRVSIALHNGTIIQATTSVASDKTLTLADFHKTMELFLQEYQLTITDINDFVISSVVPAMTAIFTAYTETYLGKKPFVITPDLKTGITIGLEVPEEIGPDLLVGAVAAFEQYKTNCIILDFGTASTVTAIDETGVFLGGSILAGFELMMKALLGNTALLSFDQEINLDAVAAIGNSTEKAILSGMFYGYGGSIDNIVSNFIAELTAQGKTDYVIVATGGLATFLQPLSKYINNIQPNLLFDGMLSIYQQNQN